MGNNSSRNAFHSTSQYNINHSLPSSDIMVQIHLLRGKIITHPHNILHILLHFNLHQHVSVVNFKYSTTPVHAAQPFHFNDLFLFMKITRSVLMFTSPPLIMVSPILCSHNKLQIVLRLRFRFHQHTTFLCNHHAKEIGCQGHIFYHLPT